MIYVGVDISKDFFDCAYLMNPDQGYQTKRFQNDRSDLSRPSVGRLSIAIG